MSDVERKRRSRVRCSYCDRPYTQCPGERVMGDNPSGRRKVFICRDCACKAVWLLTSETERIACGGYVLVRETY